MFPVLKLLKNKKKYKNLICYCTTPNSQIHSFFLSACVIFMKKDTQAINKD